MSQPTTTNKDPKKIYIAPDRNKLMLHDGEKWVYYVREDHDAIRELSQHEATNYNSWVEGFGGSEKARIHFNVPSNKQLFKIYLKNSK